MALKPPLLELEIESKDIDTVRLPVRRSTVMRWEKMFPGRAAGQLQGTEVKYTYLYELAYIVARAQGLAHTAQFADFCDTYEVAEAEDVPVSETVDPTQPVVSTVDSSS